MGKQEKESRPVLLQLENAAVKYRLKRKLAGSSEYWALKNVSLTVRDGDLIGILGFNGAGKSTLMKLLAGIIAPDRGSVWKRKRLKVSLLSLGIGFESNLTGRENARLNGMLLGMHSRTIEKRLNKIQDFSELGEFFDQPVYTYSSGMITRLGFSVAMEVDPDVMLIDEVLSVGDASFLRKSEAALRERFNARRTMILITHQPDLVQSLCEKVIWIDKGCTVAEGMPSEIVPLYHKAAEAKNKWLPPTNKLVIVPPSEEECEVA